MNKQDKIHQLLASEQIEHVQLGLSLIESQGIDLEPYQKLVEFHQKYYQSEDVFEEDLNSIFSREILRIKLSSLETLPEEIALLPRLREIKCYHNQLKVLPSSIGNMQQLEVLDLYCNQIRELPEEICLLKNLKRLDLYDNQLTQLPEYIGALKNLEDLNIASNPIKELPPSIGELRNLRVFKLHATATSASERVALRAKLPKKCKLIC